MDRKTERACPVCEHGVVQIADLNKGARCSYCHRLIETRFSVIAGVPLVLAAVLTLAFEYGIGWLGYLCAVLIVLFTASYENVLAKYLPIKHYGDSD